MGEAPNDLPVLAGNVQIALGHLRIYSYSEARNVADMTAEAAATAKEIERLRSAVPAEQETARTRITVIGAIVLVALVLGWMTLVMAQFSDEKAKIAAKVAIAILGVSGIGGAAVAVAKRLRK